MKRTSVIPESHISAMPRWASPRFTIAAGPILETDDPLVNYLTVILYQVSSMHAELGASVTAAAARAAPHTRQHGGSQVTHGHEPRPRPTPSTGLASSRVTQPMKNLAPPAINRPRAFEALLAAGPPMSARSSRGPAPSDPVSARRHFGPGTAARRRVSPPLLSMGSASPRAPGSAQSQAEPSVRVGNVI